jgi:uncharacterized cupin superfamily protein
LVVSGTPTLRHPDGEEQLEPWDLVFFPAGPAGAHLVRNNSASTARVAMFSSSGATVGAVVYPDRDMVWVWTADDAVDMVVERSSKVDDIAHLDLRAQQQRHPDGLPDAHGSGMCPDASVGRLMD